MKLATHFAHRPAVMNLPGSAEVPASPKVSFPQSARMSFARQRNRFYTRTEKLLSLILDRRRLKVLLSEKPDWRENIESGFRRIRHTVEFGPVTHENSGQFDVIVPLTSTDTMRARQNATRGLGNLIPTPSEECMDLCNDKYKFNLTLQQAGFSQFVPRMDVGIALCPPYILKKRIGSWGTDCHIVSDYNDENRLIERVKDPEFFCQEIIRGRFEFATHILFVRNRIAKALNVMYEFASETPIKGQDKPIYTVVHRCAYLRLLAEVLRTIGYEGLCCVNYKVADGHPYILEINPRFGGSLAPYFFSFLRHLH